MIKDWFANFFQVPPAEGVYVKWVMKPIKYQIRYGDDGEVITEELEDYPLPRGPELTD